VIGNLDRTDQQQEAAAAGVSALPPDATPAVVAKVIGNLDTPDQQRQAAAAAMSALSPAGFLLVSLGGDPWSVSPHRVPRWPPYIRTDSPLLTTTPRDVNRSGTLRLYATDYGGLRVRQYHFTLPAAIGERPLPQPRWATATSTRTTHQAHAMGAGLPKHQRLKHL
jgi:hypothetical protein